MDGRVTYLPLIKQWEDFIKARNSTDLEEFAKWLLVGEQDKRILSGELQEYFDANNRENGYSAMNSEASYLIFRLSKFLKFYTKPVFTAAGLNNQDEFALLADVHYLKECTKKTAIENNLIDPTTGIDMIRRLVAKKYLKERVNKEDKREKLISITLKGEQALQSIYKGFASVQEVLVGMNDDEKLTLVSFLKNLDQYHTAKFVEKSESS